MPEKRGVKEAHMSRIILRVLCGSRAHGTQRPDSDWDYRGVFVHPTSEVILHHNRLRAGGTLEESNWNLNDDGREDDTTWELGKFLYLATKSNPSILEVFLAPRVTPDGGIFQRELGIDYDLYHYPPGKVPDTKFEEEVRRATNPSHQKMWGWGTELRNLFKHAWSSRGVRDAFIGYSDAQQKKMLRQDTDKKRARAYACAYLRVLYQGYCLLEQGHLPVRIVGAEIGTQILRWKSQDILDLGEVINVCCVWRRRLELAYEKNSGKETNYEPLREFLLRVRKEYWSDENNDTEGPE